MSNCVNTAVDPQNSSPSSSHSSSPSSSHSSSDNASLEERENCILALPYLNSLQRNTTYIKVEAEELGKDNHVTPTDDGGVPLCLANTTYTAGEDPDTAGEVFETAGEVFETAGEVFEKAGEVFETAGEVFETAGEVLETAGEVLDMASEVFEKNKKNTRQEVDPNKYFEVINTDGVIFACSECGNKYKWKKSLNKHWKEKHNEVQFMKTSSFPGLNILLETGKYTYIEHGRKLYDNSFLRTVQIQGSDEASYASLLTSVQYYSHQSNKSPTMPISHDWTSPGKLKHTKGTDNIITTLMANYGNPATTPQLLTHNSYIPSDTNIQDLSGDPNQSSQNAPISRKTSEHRTLSSYQEQPLDLTRNSDTSENNVPEMSRQNFSTSTNWSIKAQSELTTKSETESITSFQMHKRVVGCFSCKLPLKSMDHLNNHFMTHHLHLLAKYKEAVKRIPYGLQQCYHLLDMEIIDMIAELSYQDLGSLDRTILACNRCGFEAKGAADLQKHSVIHADERPYMCIVCGTKYVNKWDLVKHFERRHESGGLLNPYRRNDRKEAVNNSEEEPPPKKAKFESSKMEGIVNAISGKKETSSCQQNSLDLTKMQAAVIVYRNTTSTEGTPIEQNTDQTPPKNDQFPDICTDKTVPCLPYAIQDTVIFKPNRTWGKDTKVLKGSELKQFRCPECEFTCARLSQLEKHWRIHTNEKPFKCPTPNCPYKTNWKWDVTKHLTRCGASGKSRVGKPSVVYKKKGSRDRKSPWSTSLCSSQAINGNASASSNTEAQTDYPRADSRAISKKNSGHVNGNCDHNNNTANIKDRQVTSLKQAIGVISKKHKTNSRQSPSKMVWRCIHCSFSTHNQATLKRHSLCHSEDKPFRCEVCSYSTKWTGDLTKHKKCYNHFLKRNESQETEETHEELQSRFKCFHCTLCFITLQELAEHHRTTHAATEPSQTPRQTMREVVMDMARIKHPRKRTLLIQCQLCPFKAPPLQMLAHLDKYIHCLFCGSLFEHKASFFDHLIIHVEFIPKEWEPYFKMSETELLQSVSAETYQMLVDNGPNHRSDYEPPGRHAGAKEINQNYRNFEDDNNDKSTVHSSPLTCQPDARSSHILASQRKLRLSMHTCDWCLEMFDSLTAVYEHARLHHLSELNNQALEMAKTVNESV